MKSLVFIGAKRLGFLCLQYLIENQKKLGYNILAVITNQRGSEVQQLSYDHKIQVLDDLEQYLNLNHVDILISVQYHEILKIEHLQKAGLSVNLHMAPLPEYRGCNQFSFAILNEDKIFGTTLHVMDCGVDSGDILCERGFEIPRNFWVQDLLILTEKHSLEMFCEFLPRLISSDYTVVSQNELKKNRKSRFYKRSDIERIKHLQFDWPEEKLLRHIRATCMPGFTGPYFFLDGKKIYLELNNE